MDEQEWLASAEPGSMAACLRQLGTNRRIVCHLAGKVMLRKIQLFVCGCCRLQWDDLTDDRSRKAVEVAERHADGLAKKLELRQARQGAEEATRGGWWPAAHYLAAQATKVAGEQAWSALRSAACQATIPLLRCDFGNPFRPVTLDPTWLTRTVFSLAQAGYDERLMPSGQLSPVRLAILADALEEAGCTDATILDHLRGPGPHVRGCWPVDLLTGRA